MLVSTACSTPIVTVRTLRYSPPARSTARATISPRCPSQPQTARPSGSPLAASSPSLHPSALTASTSPRILSAPAFRQTHPPISTTTSSFALAGPAPSRSSQPQLPLPAPQRSSLSIMLMGSISHRASTISRTAPSVSRTGSALKTERPAGSPIPLLSPRSSHMCLDHRRGASRTSRRPVRRTTCTTPPSSLLPATMSSRRTQTIGGR